MTFQLAQQQLYAHLKNIYGDREALTITDWVLEHITGRNKTDRITYKETLLPSDQIQLLETYTKELLDQKPVQYVLHEAWFCGMRLYVDENVLIPRPETEELVDWIVEEMDNKQLATDKKCILDVGTGSGCIAIALKKKLPAIEIYSCDISEGALKVAVQNTVEQNADIKFLQLDFLDKQEWDVLPAFHILVSNPPYVPMKDENTMHKNVLQYEPHTALFVKNDDALLFYKAIASFAKEKLLINGAIYVEIHEDAAKEVKDIFISAGFTNVVLKKDMQQKDRMIKATK